MITFVTLIVISVTSNIIINQIDPLEWIKDKLGLGIVRKTFSKIKFIDIIIYSIHKILNCVGCLSYWISVVYFLPSLEGFYLGLISYALSTWMYNNIFTTRL